MTKGFCVYLLKYGPKDTLIKVDISGVPWCTVEEDIQGLGTLQEYICYVRPVHPFLKYIPRGGP